VAVEEQDDVSLAIQRLLRERAPPRLPTRLIDVGPPTDAPSPTVHLYETRPGDADGPSSDFRYVALSHRWGVPTLARPAFCTTAHNLAAHVAQGMALAQLPPTFRDAVVTTRALGLRYLWIDSICIVQGDGGDFKRECKRMEDVFSAAYCVVAATCADGQWDGFLKGARPQGEYVAFPTRGADGGAGAPFYVCQYVDDFNGQVLDGEMNKRGWVLQERALARRTIYFAGQQTFFECGAGVRCETLTKMSKYELPYP
jgi:hypothetical protein